LSSQARRASAQRVDGADEQSLSDLPQHLLRTHAAQMPEVSELQTVRHYTNLSRKNFSIDTQFYPLGSCTMKYNPRGAHKAASLPGFLGRHPLAPESVSQGHLACLHDLQEILRDVTGMKGVSLAPMAGAQGEFAGVAMIRAYHQARGDEARTEIIVPNAAHGTNPATAVMCGYKVTEVPVNADGDVDLAALRACVGPQTAGLMMTNPSTCGVFERQIKEIAETVHGAGGLLYYDGANLNAILGKVKPGDMGFDVLHMNLHKTFATPHGGGGPGAGPVGVSERLLPHLPLPVVAKQPMLMSLVTVGWALLICQRALARCRPLQVMRAFLFERSPMHCCWVVRACIGLGSTRLSTPITWRHALPRQVSSWLTQNAARPTNLF
jgi:glycine dehydrogenase subunit 2